jgi:hypothetical protein
MHKIALYSIHDGETTLTKAVQNNSYEIVQFLIDGGLYVNGLRNDGVSQVKHT